MANEPSSFFSELSIISPFPFLPLFVAFFLSLAQTRQKPIPLVSASSEKFYEARAIFVRAFYVHVRIMCIVQSTLEFR